MTALTPRLFLDEENLRSMGFAEPNVRTLRALTAFLNLQNTVDAQQEFIGPLQDLTTAGLLVRAGANLWTTRSITGTSGHISVADGDGVLAAPTLSLPNSGVTAGTYGDGTHVAQITYDAQGRATAASSVAISFPSASVQTLLDGIGSTQGDILYRDASAWAALAPGTSGQVLTTGGAAANPSWQNAAAGGSSWELGEDGSFIIIGQTSGAFAYGCGIASSSTSNRALASTTAITKQRRVALAPASATNTLSRINTSTAEVLGASGYTIRARFALETGLSDGRIFVGALKTTPSGSSDPSGGTNIVGIGKDAADSAFQIMTNDGSGSATKTSLGANFPATTSGTDYYDVEFVMAAGGASMTYSVTRVNTGDTATGTISTNLPDPTQGLQLQVWFGTSATAASIVGNLMWIYAKGFV